MMWYVAVVAYPLAGRPLLVVGCSGLCVGLVVGGR